MSHFRFEQKSRHKHLKTPGAWLHRVKGESLAFRSYLPAIRSSSPMICRLLRESAGLFAFHSREWNTLPKQCHKFGIPSNGRIQHPADSAIGN
jgi:hypothetical protein